MKRAKMCMKSNKNDEKLAKKNFKKIFIVCASTREGAHFGLKSMVTTYI